MYEEFFGFTEPPFNLTPDSRYLFLSRGHKEALAALLFGISQQKGFIALTGEIGCGKTTLCRALLNELDRQSAKTAIILNSFLSDLELLKAINEDFGLPAKGEGKKDFVDELNRFLLQQHEQGHTVVLIIDEAQNLQPKVLEQIRMLSNLETEMSKLIQIVLIGQPELNAVLNLPQLEQLNQRITVRYHIYPLEEDEVEQYIRHRFQVARAKIAIELPPESLRLAYQYSRGVPRKINVLMDRVLLAAYVEGTFSLHEQLIRNAMKEVTGEAPKKKMSLFGEVTIQRRREILTTTVGVLIIAIFTVGAAAVAVMLANRSFEYRPRTAAQPLEEAAGAIGPQTQAHADPPTLAAKVVDPEPAETPRPRATRSVRAPEAAVIARDWDVDRDGIVRVRNDADSRLASVVNLLKLWGFEVDLTTFRNSSREAIARFRIEVLGDKIGMHTQDVGDNLSLALKFDMPVLVSLHDPSGKLAKYVVLRELDGEAITIFDPVHGRKIVKRAAVEPLITNTMVVYFDHEGFANIQRGEKSRRVQLLQGLLASEQCYKISPPSGVFDGTTIDALEAFQRRNQLDVTGYLDPYTTVMICARSLADRPRLFSSGGLL